MKQQSQTFTSDPGGRLWNLFDELVPSDGMPLKLRCILEGLGRNVGADRSYVYFLSDLANAIWDNVYEWCAEGVESIIGRQQKCDMTRYPDMRAALEAGQIWSFCDIAKTHPNTRAAFEPQGLKAMIIAPFRGVDGNVTGCVGFDFMRTHPRPIPSLVVRNLMEAVNLLTASLLFRREQTVFRSADEELLEAGIGRWSFEFEEGLPPRMYGNKTMDALLGCDGASLTPQEYYRAWYDHIDPRHYDEVRKTVDNLVAGHQAEVQYPFQHPLRGRMWVRCGGVRDLSYKKGVRIVGHHRDISEIVHLQKDNEAELSAVQRLADFEKDRADKINAINQALEMLVEEHDVVRLRNRLLSIWCKTMKVQWLVLGEFVPDGYRIVYYHAALEGTSLFNVGETLAYIPEIGDDSRFVAGDDMISCVDFQGTTAAEVLAKASNVPKTVRGIASCHSRVIRKAGKRWGSVILLFQDRHELTKNELNFVVAASHIVELALMRQT